MFSMTSRKQVVSLTSAIFMVTLITNFVGLIKDAEATPSIVTTVNVTHACVDSDHGGQSDICKIKEFTELEYTYPWAGHQQEYPHGWHVTFFNEKNQYTSEHVTSCSQCSW